MHYMYELVLINPKMFEVWRLNIFQSILADLLGDENYPLPHVSRQESLQDVPIKRRNIFTFPIRYYYRQVYSVLSWHMSCTWDMCQKYSFAISINFVKNIY